jgi:hypothetical protein
VLFLILALIGVVLGLTVKKFQRFEIRHIRLVYYIIVVQLSVRLLSLIVGVDLVEMILNPIQMITFLIILILLVYNRKQVGIMIIGMGFIMNLIVMMVNQGKMPVLINQVVEFDLRHTMMIESTKLKILGDIIRLPHPLDIGMMISSIGDIVIAVGLMIIIAQMIYTEKTNKKINKI